MKCRHCHSSLSHCFLDLGFAPPSNDYLSAPDLQAPEKHFPLKVYVCGACFLVQTQDFSASEELFRGDYAYFSSVSKGWLAHAAQYAEMIARRLDLGRGSFVVELASNDGYLLRNFVAAGIPCLGVEPTEGTARAAEQLGIRVRKAFFGEALGREIAAQERKADLIAGNNVYAHVPDINDFTRGMAALLEDEGTITLEFPHLQELIANNQFDTVYHEHYSYLSLHAVSRLFAAAGLRVYDVETLPTHGGSLRVYGCHAGASHAVQPRVADLLQGEEAAGLCRLETYTGFQAQADKVKNDLLSFLLAQKNAGKRVVAYGAAAKGNTLLNYAGVRPDLLPAVFDAAPSKQGKYLPGSHIPVLPPERMAGYAPDFILILPWNIAPEVIAQLRGAGYCDGQFVTAVPFLQIR
jgi:hypothetical protein